MSASRHAHTKALAGVIQMFMTVVCACISAFNLILQELLLSAPPSILMITELMAFAVKCKVPVVKTI
jgi:hypothetical protein